MKLYVLTFAIFSFAYNGLIAQSDPVCTFNYQAVIRDATDAVIPDRSITVRLSVLDGPEGNALYIEEHSTITSSLGLFSLEVGAGVKIGGSLDWMAIPWIARRHYLKVEVDITGGQSFEVLGESPILAVPIAIQAKFAAFAYQTIDTLTKVIQTLCADTLKSKIACLDTLKSDSAHIKIVTSNKVKTTDLCADTIKINFEDGPKIAITRDPVYEGDILAHIDRIEGTLTVDTIEVAKLKAYDVCTDVVSLYNGLTGEAIPVLKIDNLLEETSLMVDSVCAEFIKVTDQDGNVIGSMSEEDGMSVIDIDKLTSDSICTDVVLMKNPAGEIIGVMGEYDGRSLVDVSKIFADSICTDEVRIINSDGESIGIIGEFLGMSVVDFDKIYSDLVCADEIIASNFSLPGIFGNEQVLGYNQVGEPELTVNKVKTNSICAKDLQIIDEQGKEQAFLGYEFGESLLQLDKIIAQDICTEDLSMFLPNGERLFEINLLANRTNEYGIIFNHNIMVNGGIMANFKQFVIDHPLDPENKNLRHFSIESDKMVNIYSGTVTLDENGEAWVQLPDWFEALNTDFTYQLTCIGGFSNVYIGEKIAQNRFKIAGGTVDLEVSWQVNGVRHDKQALELNLPVEESK